jgi:hypothetical protein
MFFKIIKEINYRHGYRIDDIVEVLGLIFYRPDFEKKFNINFREIKERAMRMSREISDFSDIDKIYKKNKVMFDIDEILDKINKVGIENLTNEEKELYENIFKIKFKKSNVLEVYYELYCNLKIKYNKIYKDENDLYTIIPRGKFSIHALSKLENKKTEINNEIENFNNCCNIL